MFISAFGLKTLKNKKKKSREKNPLPSSPRSRKELQIPNIRSNCNSCCNCTWTDCPGLYHLQSSWFLTHSSCLIARRSSDHQPTIQNKQKSSITWFITSSSYSRTGLRRTWITQEEKITLLWPRLCLLLFCSYLQLLSKKHNFTL